LDYDAGMDNKDVEVIRSYLSNKLILYFYREIMVSRKNPQFYGHYQSKEERILNNQKGEFAEEFVKRMFQSEGKKIISIQIVSEIEKGVFRNELNIDGIKSLINPNKVFNDMMDVQRNIKKVHWPDFLIEDKVGNVEFIEVKSYVRDVKNVMQKKTLEELGKKGYKVSMFMLPIDREFYSLFSENPTETLKKIDYYKRVEEVIITNWELLDNESRALGIQLGICPDKLKKDKNYNRLRNKILATFQDLETKYEDKLNSSLTI